ncbi:MAG TPA: hypothetical protein VGU73_07725 [Acidimicrobiia bacterium]|nr:hypothetical protein [Acidimicrobiia bacterium]
MKIKHLIAGALVAGITTVGMGGAAFASSPPPKPSTTTKADSEFCERWVPRLPALDAQRVRDEQQIDDLQKAIEFARDHHREDLVEALERKLDEATRDHTRVVLEIAVIHYRCHV